MQVWAMRKTIKQQNMLPFQQLVKEYNQAMHAQDSLQSEYMMVKNGELLTEVFLIFKVAGLVAETGAFVHIQSRC